MTSEVREALGGHKATFFATLLYSREGWREEEIVKVIKDGHEVANHCKVRGGGEAGGGVGGGGTIAHGNTILTLSFSSVLVRTTGSMIRTARNRSPPTSTRPAVSSRVATRRPGTARRLEGGSGPPRAR